jgi:hypothetical protein
MLLWLVVALGFVICVASWHLWQGITWGEAAALFVASALVFAVHLHVIYDKATTDSYMVSGYVSSLIHRDGFSYECGRHTCHEPERWIVVQRPQFPYRNFHYERSIHSGGAVEDCQGECNLNFPAPYSQSACCRDGFFYAILVDEKKFSHTQIGDSSTLWRNYFNPVRVSDEVVYNAGKILPYFSISDYNRAHRIIPYRADAEESLEKINAEFARDNIALAVILTKDNLFYETLKRSWHSGKANDFVVVINTDGQTIRNVNVLAWNNYVLRENVAEAIMVLPHPDLNQILSAIETTLKQGPNFVPMDFSAYHYLQVKIPENYYWRIILFQAFFFIYMLMLLRFNPNTKDYKVPLSQILQMWDKRFSPPSASWYLHPLTPTGLALYVVVPFMASLLLWA